MWGTVENRGGCCSRVGQNGILRPIGNRPLRFSSLLVAQQGHADRFATCGGLVTRQSLAWNTDQRR